MNLVRIGEYGYQNYGAEEIFNFEINDERHILKQTICIDPGNSSYSSEKKSIYKVIDKNSSSNTVTYTYDQCYRREYIDFDNSSNSYTTSIHDTISQTIDFTSQYLELSNLSLKPYSFDNYSWRLKLYNANN